MLVLKEVHVGLHRTVQLFRISGWGTDLDYVEQFASEMNEDHSVVFELYPGTTIPNSLLNISGKVIEP